MQRIPLVLATVVLLSASPAFGQNEQAESVLQRIEAVESPRFDGARREDQAYIAEYYAAREQASRERCSLILELYKVAPKHDRVPGLMAERWSLLTRQLRDNETAINEATKVLKDHPDGALAIEAAHAVATTLASNPSESDRALQMIDRFVALAPKDPRAPRLLMSLAGYGERDPKKQRALYERIIRDYPDARSTPYAAGKVRQITQIGKPVELTFNDAATDRTIRMKDLNGKVVVLDFWATWCGPCIAEMPHMKELYAKYHEQGVEFIGISLDNPEDKGGRDKLLAYVKDNQIPWPQYYQGNGWNSEFSQQWGVNAIPALFVIDTRGHLHSTSARGKLDTMIPALLKASNPG